MRYVEDIKVAETVEEFNTLYKGRSIFFHSRDSRSTRYADITATLDIETTNTPDDGFIYSIQCCIDGVTAVFRYVEDFINLMEEFSDRCHLNMEKRMVLYVHNLGYENHYLTPILHNAWSLKKSLFVKSRKPLYLVFGNGIELRDSLRLFQKSLARVTENVTHKKRSGELDYRIYRTPDTPISDDEWPYLVNDVVGLWEAIEDFKRQHNYRQDTIVLTNTGLVLDTVNRMTSHDKTFRSRTGEIRLTKSQMWIAYKAMAGGDTHGARWGAGRTYENCNSYDLKSAHPSEMLLEKFPAGEPFNLPENTPEKDLRLLAADGKFGFVGKFFIADMRIRPECPDPTISLSKVEDMEGCTGYDNGRVLGCDGCIVYMDSNDYTRFREAYIYSEFVMIEGFAFRLEYLPQSFRDAIKQWFENKENLGKDNPEYMFSKICVNTIYGACAQKTIRDSHILSFTADGEMKFGNVKWEETLKASSEKEVLHSQRSKLPYLWGLWTASLSRLKLWKLMKVVGWSRCIYWDTDSVKYVGPKIDIYTLYNKEIMEKCKDRKCVVIDRSGKEVYIGAAEDEYPDVPYGYRKFRFLHAKCYAAEAWNKKKEVYELEATIAGVGKAEGRAALEGDINRLDSQLYINPAGGKKLVYHERPVRTRMFKRETLSAGFIFMEERDYQVNFTELDYVDTYDLEILG